MAVQYCENTDLRQHWHGHGGVVVVVVVVVVVTGGCRLIKAKPARPTRAASPAGIRSGSTLAGFGTVSFT